MHITTNFYNKLKNEIGATYFPSVRYYRDDINYTKAAYAIELFNNGVINYMTLVKRLQKSCKAERIAIERIINLYLDYPLTERIIARVQEKGTTGLYKAYEFGDLLKELSVTPSKLRTALNSLIKRNIVSYAVSGTAVYGGRRTYYLAKHLEISK